MDSIWDCMNLSNRVIKQAEQSDDLVPKSQSGSVTPLADLQELIITVGSIRTILVPFVTSSKKSKVVSEPAFEICVKGVKQTLETMHSFFKDLEKEFAVTTWKTQKVKLYQIDFALKQKLDQFNALFNVESEGKDKKNKGAIHSGAKLIADPEGKEFWTKLFGEMTMMVPWSVFFTTFEAHLNASLREYEEFLKPMIDFTSNDHVSSYEFSVFLKWFGPLKGCTDRWLYVLKGGYLCGFTPAIEANLLLEGKRDGSYLIRCSKTQPGSFAVTFVDHMMKVKHCLLYSVHPNGFTLKNPPTIYACVEDFIQSHTNRLKYPLGNKYTMTKKLHGFEYRGEAAEEKESNNITEGNYCIVCMDAPMQTVFLECGHLACCTRCSEKLKNCPICRNAITRVIPFYRAS